MGYKKEVEKMSYIKKLEINDQKEKEAIISQKESNELAWVYPNALSNSKKINLKKMKQVIIKFSEKALVFSHESFVKELSNGVYSLETKNGAEGHKIVFLEKAPFDLKWGIPQMQGAITSDRVKIGLSGVIKLKISNSQVFALNVLKDKNKMKREELKPIIINIIKSAMREIIPQYSAEEVQKLPKDELLLMLEPTIVEELQKLGLSSEDITISGIGVPPEFRIF